MLPTYDKLFILSNNYFTSNSNHAYSITVLYIILPSHIPRKKLPVLFLEHRIHNIDVVVKYNNIHHYTSRFPNDGQTF